jgi:hypothetical protein
VPADGGNEQLEFALRESEHVAVVKGRRGAYVDSVQFVTSTGRESPRYSSGGGGNTYEFDIGGPVRFVLPRVSRWIGGAS